MDTSYISFKKKKTHAQLKQDEKVNAVAHIITVVKSLTHMHNNKINRTRPSNNSQGLSNRLYTGFGVKQNSEY